MTTSPNKIAQDVEEGTLDQWAEALANEDLPLGINLAVISSIADFKHKLGIYLPLSHLYTRIAAVCSLMLLDGVIEVDGVRVESVKQKYIEKSENENL